MAVIENQSCSWCFAFKISPRENFALRGGNEITLVNKAWKMRCCRREMRDLFHQICAIIEFEKSHWGSFVTSVIVLFSYLVSYFMLETTSVVVTYEIFTSLRHFSCDIIDEEVRWEIKKLSNLWIRHHKQTKEMSSLESNRQAWWVGEFKLDDDDDEFRS